MMTPDWGTRPSLPLKLTVWKRERANFASPDEVNKLYLVSVYASELIAVGTQRHIYGAAVKRENCTCG